MIVNEGTYQSDSHTEKAESEFKAPMNNNNNKERDMTVSMDSHTNLAGNKKTEVLESSIDDTYDEEVPQDMMDILGFTDFISTKGRDHSKSSVEGVFKNSKHAMKPRQYMNRRGGFNKPLDKI